eukprot:494504-Alexandrium_andersonii.AAC.1
MGLRRVARSVQQPDQNNASEPAGVELERMSLSRLGRMVIGRRSWGPGSGDRERTIQPQCPRN